MQRGRNAAPAARRSVLRSTVLRSSGGGGTFLDLLAGAASSRAAPATARSTPLPTPPAMISSGALTPNVLPFDPAELPLGHRAQGLLDLRAYESEMAAACERVGARAAGAVWSALTVKGHLGAHALTRIARRDCTWPEQHAAMHACVAAASASFSFPASSPAIATACTPACTPVFATAFAKAAEPVSPLHTTPARLPSVWVALDPHGLLQSALLLALRLYVRWTPCRIPSAQRHAAWPSAGPLHTALLPHACDGVQADVCGDCARPWVAGNGRCRSSSVVSHSDADDAQAHAQKSFLPEAAVSEEDLVSVVLHAAQMQGKTAARRATLEARARAAATAASAAAAAASAAATAAADSDTVLSRRQSRDWPVVRVDELADADNLATTLHVRQARGVVRVVLRSLVGDTQPLVIAGRRLEMLRWRRAGAAAVLRVYKDAGQPPPADVALVAGTR